MTRRAARALGTLVTGLLAVLVVAVPSLGAMSSAAPGTGLPVEVAITGIAPLVLGPNDDLTVTVRVRNTGTTAIAEPRVAVGLDRSSFISRSSLDRWRTAAPGAGVGSIRAQVDLPAPLAPGQAVTAEVVVPAASVGLPRRLSSWGARGLAVTVVDRADPARPRLGVARTFVVWFPDQEVNPTHVSVLAPVVGPPVDPLTGAWATALAAETAAGGRLAELLDATAAHPVATWVLDPWLLEAAPAAGPAAEDWVADLRAGLTDREVQLLPYLDADVAALAHTGQADLLAAAIRRGEDTARAADLPDAARVSLAWPADDLPDLATASLAGRADDLALVVGPGELLPPAVLTYTPSGRTSVTAGGEDVTVLVPDERLSWALGTGQVGDAGLDEERATGTVTPATAAQDLLAELAVVTRERPNDSRHVLLTVPRDWAPDVDVAQAQLAALAEVPWVRPAPVSALIGLADPEIDRGTLPQREVHDAEIRSAALSAVRSATERRAALAEMVADPAELVGDPELELLAPLSVAWRADPAGREASVAASRAATTAIADAVGAVAPSEVINLISRSGDLPLQVRNDLTEPVDVTVGLRASDPRLRADEAVPVTIPAEGQVLVQIPVHAVQSADLQVTVEVRTLDGELVDDDVTFPIRVRADWEGIGVAAIGTLLAIGLVVGIVRTIRRGRTARRAAPEPAAGPDALSPEEAGDDEGDDGTGTGGRHTDDDRADDDRADDDRADDDRADDAAVGGPGARP